MESHPSSGTGVHTGFREKIRYCKATHDAMTKGKIRFAESLIGRNPDKTKMGLRDQLARYEGVPVPQPLGKDTEYKVFLSGKRGGRQDDLSMAFQFAVFWPFVQYELETFQEFCRNKRLNMFTTGYYT